MTANRTTTTKRSVVKDQPPERSAWEEYEREKRRLQAMQLPPKEYENAIDRLAERLGL